MEIPCAVLDNGADREYVRELQGDETSAQIFVLKNRDGRVGRIPCRFDIRQLHFESVEENPTSKTWDAKARAGFQYAKSLVSGVAASSTERATGKITMTTTELFALAEKIRGALWLMLYLDSNVGPAGPDGWQKRADGKGLCRPCMAEICGTNEETVEKWVNRLIALEIIRARRVEQPDPKHNLALSVGWAIELRHGFLGTARAPVKWKN